ncbi:hypothetical protein D3C76_1245900 [compost metagenome]
MVNQGDRFPGAAKIHRQFAADKPRADNHHPLGVTQRGFAGPVLHLAVEGQHQLAARNRRHKGRGPGGQNQFVIRPLLVFPFNHVRCGINVGDPGVREQAQVKLFGKLPRRLAGEVVGMLTLADHVA